MADHLRALVAFVICMALTGTASAGLVAYRFSAVITDRGVLPPLSGAPIGPGDAVAATFLVDDSVVPSGTSTYAYFSQAIVGGTVEAGGMQWTLGGSGENFVSVWNDELISADTAFDGLWLQAPLAGPALVGLAPDYFGFVLFSYEQGANDAINETALPLALDLADFQAFAGGSMAFGTGSGAGRFDLEILAVSVAPVPLSLPSAMLLVGSVVPLLMRRFRKLARA